MQGICGLCSWEPGSNPAALVDALAKTMCSAPDATRSEFRRQEAAVITHSMWSEEGLAAETDVALALIGDLPYKSQLADNVPAVTADSPTPAILLARYLKNGVPALTNLNGVYAAVVWDGRSHELHIVTDRFAYRKLYYWHSRRGVVFATECKAILAHPDCPRTVSPEALADMMAFRYVSGQDTYWPHIKLAPPGSVLTFSHDGIAKSRYWQWAYAPPETLQKSEDAYAAEFWELFRQAVAVRTEPRMVFPLTGGMDSRCMTAAALRSHPTGTYESATIGQVESLDMEYACRLAKDLKIPHTLCPLESDFLVRYGAEAVRRSEGMTINHTCWRMAIEPFMAERGYESTMNGFLGVVVKGGTLLNRFSDVQDPDAMWRYFAERYAGATTLGDLHKLLRPAYKDLAALPFDKMAKRYAEEIASDNPFDRDAYYEFMHFECRYIGVAYDYCTPHFRIRAPLADYHLMDYSLSMPRPLRRKARLFTKMLTTYLPEAARAPYVKTGMPPGAGTLERALYKARGRLYYKVLPAFGLGATRNLNVYVHYSEWLRTGSRPYVEVLMAERERLAEWFEPDVMTQLVQDHYDGSTNHYGQVYALLTLIEWHRQFAG